MQARQRESVCACVRVCVYAYTCAGVDARGTYLAEVGVGQWVHEQRDWGCQHATLTRHEIHDMHHRLVHVQQRGVEIHYTQGGVEAGEVFDAEAGGRALSRARTRPRVYRAHEFCRGASNLTPEAQQVV
eukprot:3652108-Rhodomonas_salina.2